MSELEKLRQLEKLKTAHALIRRLSDHLERSSGGVVIHTSKELLRAAREYLEGNDE